MARRSRKDGASFSGKGICGALTSRHGGKTRLTVGGRPGVHWVSDADLYRITRRIGDGVLGEAGLGVVVIVKTEKMES